MKITINPNNLKEKSIVLIQSYKLLSTAFPNEYIRVTAVKSKKGGLRDFFDVIIKPDINEMYLDSKSLFIARTTKDEIRERGISFVDFAHKFSDFIKGCNLIAVNVDYIKELLAKVSHIKDFDIDNVYIFDMYKADHYIRRSNSFFKILLTYLGYGDSLDDKPASLVNTLFSFCVRQMVLLKDDENIQETNKITEDKLEEQEETTSDDSVHFSTSFFENEKVSRIQDFMFNHYKLTKDDNSYEFDELNLFNYIDGKVVWSSYSDEVIEGINIFDDVPYIRKVKAITDKKTDTYKLLKLACNIISQEIKYFRQAKKHIKVKELREKHIGDNLKTRIMRLELKLNEEKRKREGF